MHNAFKWFGCFLAGIALSNFIQAAPKAELWPLWDVSDETESASIDHTLWQAVLDEFLVIENGLALFDYKAALQEGGKQITTYAEHMQSLDPREFSHAEQKAYWINLYNALTVELILDNYPVSSITKLGKGWFRFGPWDDPIAEIAGEELTLNDIEHRILRPIWQDERIHFAVNCASIGCPNLSGAYTGANMEAMLNEGARNFIEHPRGANFDEKGGLTLSSLFEWYGDDFGDNKSEVLSRLADYASDDRAKLLRAYTSKISYEYDWQLNDVAASLDN